jgi:hypothetical protein
MHSVHSPRCPAPSFAPPPPPPTHTYNTTFQFTPCHMHDGGDPTCCPMLQVSRMGHHNHRVSTSSSCRCCSRLWQFSRVCRLPGGPNGHSTALLHAGCRRPPAHQQPLRVQQARASQQQQLRVPALPMGAASSSSVAWDSCFSRTFWTLWGHATPSGDVSTQYMLLWGSACVPHVYDMELFLVVCMFWVWHAWPYGHGYMYSTSSAQRAAVSGMR